MISIWYPVRNYWFQVFHFIQQKEIWFKLLTSFFYNVDPCKDISYALLSAAQRHRNQFTSGSSGCDKAGHAVPGEWQGEGWYRFVDGAGNQMADSPVTGT